MKIDTRFQIIILTALLFALTVGLISCEDHNESFSWLEKGEEFPAGLATVNDQSVNAFGNPAPNLTGDKDLIFVTGNSFFNRNWVTAPSSTEDLDGLGPMFIARSCSSCHFKDGKGSPPLEGEQPVSLLFRLSTSGTSDNGAPVPEPVYGGQFANNAILGVAPEGKVKVSYTEMAGKFADGESYSLRKPTYEFTELNYGDMDPATMVSPRIAQHMIGLGFLEAVDDQTLLDMEDPNDVNEDGISGRVNRVWNFEKNEAEIGRFGWKANQPTLRQQVAGAFNGDIGMTSSVFPSEDCTSAQQDCQNAISGGSPELKESILKKVVLYSSTLAVPKRRGWDDDDVLRGKQLFFEAKCEACHAPKLITGNHPDFPEFSGVLIRPFTDLLLHDMGEGLADSRPDYEATGNEWRTPPLWGIGLIETVNGHTNFLHDGRARNLKEAILWHGGEAQSAKESFVNMNKKDRESLIKFLNSL